MNIMSDLVPIENSLLTLLTAVVFPYSLNQCLVYTDLKGGRSQERGEREMETRLKRTRWRWGTEETETLRGREMFDSV